MAELVIAGEWRRAQECLGAARLCLDGEYFADAVSRSYYAVMHGAKAVLAHVIATDADAEEDVLPQTHDGVMNRFGLRLVRTGDIESEWAALLGQLSQMRFAADYDVMTTFSPADTWQAVERASAFLNRMGPLLRDSVP